MIRCPMCHSLAVHRFTSTHLVGHPPGHVTDSEEAPPECLGSFAAESAQLDTRSEPRSGLGFQGTPAHQAGPVRQLSARLRGSNSPESRPHEPQSDGRNAGPICPATIAPGSTQCPAHPAPDPSSAPENTPQDGGTIWAIVPAIRPGSFRWWKPPFRDFRNQPRPRLICPRVQIGCILGCAAPFWRVAGAG
jgi:hypothetical protein